MIALGYGQWAEDVREAAARCDRPGGPNPTGIAAVREEQYHGRQCGGAAGRVTHDGQRLKEMSIGAIRSTPLFG